jgi:hypothetical protein
MFEYVSQVQAPFPPIAARTFEIAKKVRQGTASFEERKGILADMWKHISEHKAWGDDTTPEYCVMRALGWLVRDRLGPGENEHISEVIDWFLFYVNKFEDHSESAAGLIQQHFSRPI